MKKVFLGLFIFLDLVMISASAYVLYAYILRQAPVRAASKSTAPAPAGPSAAAVSTAPVTTSGNAFNVPSLPSTTARKILFSYHNSRAKKVSVRADFTGWKAEEMRKTANGVWTYQAILSPGEYAYCYTADDKTFKDPANKRTKQIGRTMVSAIVVEALPSKPVK